MLTVEHTKELCNLFHHFLRNAARDTDADAHKSETPPPATPWKHHPLREAVAVTSDAQSKAGLNAQRRIKETMAALEGIAPFSPARLEGQLLLCEAELMSVSATIKELDSSLETVKGEWGYQEKAAGRRKASMPATRELSSQLLDHLMQTLAILRSRNTFWRERVALCKEELALNKNEMFRFARCGVITCEPDDIAAALGTQRKTPDNVPVQAGKSDSERRGPGFGLVSDVARKLMHKDAAVKGAFPASLSMLGMATSAGIEGLLFPTASGAAASSLLGGTEPTTQLATLTGRDVGAASFGAAAHAPPPVPRFHYTPDEERRLTEQHQSLIQKQHEASAHDAKLIEASVRELSQLTSLMNEKVVEQSEHFSVLVRNTTAARGNYDKALGELHKAEESSGRLNATRQLILLLWLSTLLLLVTNWLLQ